LGGRISNENGRPLAAFLYNEATSTGSGRHLRFEPFTILDVSIVEDFNQWVGYDKAHCEPFDLSIPEQWAFGYTL
jgi:hypothetical protein